MSWLFAGHILMGTAQVANLIYRILRPYRVGIYGSSLAGKTTLDQYMTVPGDIDPIPLQLRTSHPVKHGAFKMPHGSKKQIRWKGERIPITSTDIGGQTQYWNMWAEDIIDQDRQVIFYVIDERISQSPYVAAEMVAGFQYLVDIIVGKKYPSTFSRKMRRKAKKYKPKVVCLLINKMDLWWDNEAQHMWGLGLKRQHKMVLPFQNELRRLRRAAIPTNVEAIAAQYGLNVERAIIDTIDKI
jgi:hypothetical protein